MANSCNCCTSLFSSQITLALTLFANSELLQIMSPMHYNNYVTLHRIWAHMHCIGADSDDSTESIISITPACSLSFSGHRWRSSPPNDFRVRVRVRVSNLGELLTHGLFSEDGILVALIVLMPLLFVCGKDSRENMSTSNLPQSRPHRATQLKTVWLLTAPGNTGPHPVWRNTAPRTSHY